MEIVAGLVYGSITSLVVILSAFIATFPGHTIFSNSNVVVFAALLTLSAVAINKFSARVFYCARATKDLADIFDAAKQ